MEKEVIFTSNKEVTVVIGSIKTPFLDEMMLRFPHIVQDVLEELDNKSLTNCRNVSRICCDFIDNEKFYSVRKSKVQQNLLGHGLIGHGPRWDTVLKEVQKFLGYTVLHVF